MVLASDRFCELPGMRNSNLLPVNANGDVRLRSVLSFRNAGSTETPKSMATLSALSYSDSWSFTNASTISESSLPRKMDTMAGGASFAPRRWSLPALATDMRSSSWYSSTASMTQVKNTRKRRFSMGFSPGSSKLRPPAESDQLSCLPEPLMPSNGFSCCRHTRP